MITEQLRAIINQRNITIYRLSKMTGLSQPTLHAALSGNPTVSTVERICEALGVRLTINTLSANTHLTHSEAP